MREGASLAVCLCYVMLCYVCMRVCVCGCVDVYIHTYVDVFVTWVKGWFIDGATERKGKKGFRFHAENVTSLVVRFTLHLTYLLCSCCV